MKSLGSPAPGRKMIDRKITSLVTLALASFALAAPHKISPAQAAKIALAKYHGKLQGKPKLEKEDGAWQYEVLVKVGKIVKEVNVNAETGKIGSVENTTPGEEAREAKAEKAKGKGKGEKKGD